MNKDPLRIASVQALSEMRLRLSFEDGFTGTVDLRDWVAHTRALAKLRDPAVFRKAKVGEWGASVVFIEDTLELGADNLRNLAVEQSGGIGHERLWEWMHRNRLTQEAASLSIGISRRMLNYYLSGTKPIPKTVWLACLGWEAEHNAKQPRSKHARGMASVHA